MRGLLRPKDQIAMSAEDREELLQLAEALPARLRDADSRIIDQVELLFTTLERVCRLLAER